MREPEPTPSCVSRNYGTPARFHCHNHGWKGAMNMREGSMFDALELENCELISSVLLSYHKWLELRLSRVVDFGQFVCTEKQGVLLTVCWGWSCQFATFCLLSVLCGVSLRLVLPCSTCCSGADLPFPCSLRPKNAGSHR